MTQGTPPIPVGLDPGIAAYLEALAGRTEANVNANLDKRFSAFEARLKYVEGEVKASGKPPPPTSTPPAEHEPEDLPPILLPSGATLNGSVSPPPISATRPTLVHRTDALERKVDRLLKAHGVQPPGVGGLTRTLRWIASPEGRKQLGVLVAAIAAIYGAVHGAGAPAASSSPPSPSLPMPQGSG
jgi:hypothetical protein